MLLKKYLFMVPVLKSLDDGTPFRRGFAMALRIIAILLIVGLLITWIALWKVVFSQDGVAIFGGFIFQIFLLVGFYMIIHTYWIRADSIERLGQSEYTIIPIVSILLKTQGEVGAWASFATGLGAGIFQILAGYQFPGWSTPYESFHYGMTSSFVAGLLVIVFGAIFALVSLILSYFLAEFIIVIVDIAKNTRALRENAERQQR
jgi:hypothetical protein